MGYTTDFDGEFTLDKPLAPEHRAYLLQFSETRRMRRDAQRAVTLPDPVREAVGLPVGTDGAYCVGGLGFMGQDPDVSVTDHNVPPNGQPGLWCQWVPGENGTTIEWNGGEKFYHYEDWLVYLIEHFLKPWGYTLNGSVLWQGEDIYDRGRITVTNNELTSENLE